MSYSIQMPSVLNLPHWIGLTTLLVLQGCATNQRNSDQQLEANVDVRIQVCLPTDRIYFNDLVLDRLENHPLFTKYSQQQLELAPKSIRRVASSSDPMARRAYGISFGEVLNRQGILSDGSGFMQLHDSTVANQPIYERGYGYPAVNYIAMHVRLPNPETRPEGRVTFWFALPKDIPRGGFTDWFKPLSMEPEGQRLPIGWKLTHGGELAVFPLSPNSPKMRVSFKERSPEHNDPTTDTLPALTTARIKFKTQTNDQYFVYEFVPKSNESIPACD